MEEKYLPDRIEFLDIIKGISIILVVFIHFNILSDKTIIGNVAMQLAVCACPCFMMVSGFLQAEKKKKVTKLYFFNILKVYFQLALWKVLYFIYFIFIIKVNYTWDIGRFIRFVFLFNNYPDIDTGLFWYINALLVCMLFYPVIAIVKDNKIIIYLEILVFITGIGTDVLNSVCVYVGFDDFNFEGIRNIMPFANQPMLFFYLLGWMFNIKWKQIEKILIKKRFCYFPVFMMWGGVTGCVVLKYIQSGVWRWYGIYLENPYSRLSTVFMACGLFLFAYYLNNLPVYIKICLCKIGQNTLAVYYIHWLVAIWFKKNFFNDFKNIFSFKFNLIRTIFIVLICCLISLLYSYIISKIRKYYNNKKIC